MSRLLQWRLYQSPPGGAARTDAPWIGGSDAESSDLSKTDPAVGALGFTDVRNRKNDKKVRGAMKT